MEEPNKICSKGEKNLFEPGFGWEKTSRATPALLSLSVLQIFSNRGEKSD